MPRATYLTTALDEPGHYDNGGHIITARFKMHFGPVSQWKQARCAVRNNIEDLLGANHPTSSPTPPLASAQRAWPKACCPGRDSPH